MVGLWKEASAWSFVIKGHALVETALSELLSAYLIEARLRKPVEYLPLNGKASKVAFLRATSLLSPAEAKFVNELSSLRNHLVHNIHNVRFDFQTFLATDPKNAARLAKAVARFGTSHTAAKKLESGFYQHPQHSLWTSILFVIGSAWSALLRTDDERQELKGRIMRLYEEGGSGSAA